MVSAIKQTSRWPSSWKIHRVY